MPRRGGIVASALLVAASAGYGVVKGNHIPAMLETLKDRATLAPTRPAFASPPFRLPAASN